MTQINFSAPTPQGNGAVTIGNWIPTPFATSSGVLYGSGDPAPSGYDTSGVVNPAPPNVYKYSIYKQSAFDYFITGLTANKTYNFRVHVLMPTVYGQGYQFNISQGSVLKAAVNVVTTFKLYIYEFLAVADSSGNITLTLTPTVAGSQGMLAIMCALEYSLSIENRQDFLQGDSRMFSVQVNPNETFPHYLAQITSANLAGANLYRYDTALEFNLLGTVRIKAIGQGSATLDQNAANFSTLVTPYYDASLAENVIVDETGAIDCTDDSQTAQGIYNKIKASYDAAVAAGLKAFRGTIGSGQNPGFSSATYDRMNAVNALIRANIPANRIVDYAADSRLASAPNPTYFQDDGYHYKPAGNIAMAQITYAALYGDNLAVSAFTSPSQTASQINLSWAANGIVEISGYDLEFSLTGANLQAASGTNGWTTLLSNQLQTAFSHTARTASTQYFYRLRARNTMGVVTPYSARDATTTSSGSSGGSQFSITGANSVVRNSTSNYTTDIPSPKWSTTLGSINQSGQFTAPNQTGTATLKAVSELWQGLDSGLTSDANNDVVADSNGAYKFGYTIRKIKDVGDYAEKTVDADFLTAQTDFFLQTGMNASQADYGTFGTNRFYANGVMTPQYSSNLTVGQKLKFQVISPTQIAMKIDGATIATITHSQTNGFLIGIRAGQWNAGQKFTKPVISSSSYPEQIATKDVAITDAPPDSVPPSTVTNLTATKISDTQINLDSDAATDDVGVTGYQTQVSQNGGASWTTLSQTAKTFSFVSGNAGFPSASGTYNLQFRRKAFDAAGNYSAAYSNIQTVAITITGPPPASVLITTPVYNQIVFGTVAIIAAVTNMPDIIGVQFKLDDANIGAEDATQPFSVNLVTTLYPNGTYTLRAIARNATQSVETATQIIIKNSIVIGAVFNYKEVCYPVFHSDPMEDWDAVTDDHTYQDGGKSFNELNSVAPLEWTLIYNGLSAEDAASFDAHYTTYRTSRSFTFESRAGTYTNVFYKPNSFKKSHEKTNAKTREMIFIKYP